MTKERVMPMGLKKYTMRLMLKKLNPGKDLEGIDWDTMDPKQSFQDSYHDMAGGNPDYVWFEESLEEIEAKENEAKIQHLIDKGVDEAIIQRMQEEMDMDSLKLGWKRGWVAGKETYMKIVKIKPPTRGKCKRGRIQTTCDPELIGLEAKITIVIPEEEDNYRE